MALNILSVVKSLEKNHICGKKFKKVIMEKDILQETIFCAKQK